ncbi:N-acetyl-anhydromuranmyl-L-alanine amidase [Brevibacterium casei]|uniref:N-acetyl-anhydromuranmyl-L-alanine amidase n=1 Tax=Brevibacterium casei TaxID=33889 RepID=A0A449D7N7_9MICO|nr:N-acetylmuramoyl-L-alanine amidase [Brevibacterium casei]VEW13580.1 N-acetyl-anhydromuranmyl-L-alanine amidase [Brevibacterium casei]
MAYSLASRIERAVKKSGLKTVWVPGWKSRGRGTMGSIQTVTLHHTATPRSLRKTAEYPTYNVVKDGRPGLPGPLAQLGLGRTGVVYVFAAGVSNHAGKSRSTSMTNSRAIGIEAEGAMEAWPKEQYDAYLRLVRALIDEFNLPESRALRHAETASPPGRKNDASFSGPTFRKRLKSTRLGGTTPTAPAPKPTLEGIFGMTKRIASTHTAKQVAAKGTTKHLQIGKDQFTIASGPAWVSASVKVDIENLPVGETCYLVIGEAFYAKGKPTTLGRELATMEVIGTPGTTTATVTAPPWQLFKDWKGKNPRLRAFIKSAPRDLTISNVSVQGARD